MKLQLIFKKTTLFRVRLLLNVFNLHYIKFTRFSIKFVFRKKKFGFSTHFGHSERMFYLVNYLFPPKGVLLSLIIRVELRDDLASGKITKIVKKRKLSIFYTIFETFSKPTFNLYLPRNQMHLLLSHYVFLTLEILQIFTDFAQKCLKFNSTFRITCVVLKYFDVKDCNFLIRNGKYIPNFFAIDCFEPSNSQKVQNLYLNNMKKQQK